MMPFIGVRISWLMLRQEFALGAAGRLGPLFRFAQLNLGMFQTP